MKRNLKTKRTKKLVLFFKKNRRRIIIIGNRKKTKIGCAEMKKIIKYPVYDMQQLEKKYIVKKKRDEMNMRNQNLATLEFEFEGEFFEMQATYHEETKLLVINGVKKDGFGLLEEKKNEMIRLFEQENVDVKMKQAKEYFATGILKSLVMCKEMKLQEKEELEALIEISGYGVYYSKEKKKIYTQYNKEDLFDEKKGEINESFEEYILGEITYSRQIKEFAYMEGVYYRVSEYDFEKTKEFRIFRCNKTKNEIMLSINERSKTITAAMEEIGNKKELEIILKKPEKYRRMKVYSEKIFRDKQTIYKKGDWVLIKDKEGLRYARYGGREVTKNKTKIYLAGERKMTEIQIMSENEKTFLYPMKKMRKWVKKPMIMLNLENRGKSVEGYLEEYNDEIFSFKKETEDGEKRFQITTEMLKHGQEQGLLMTMRETEAYLKVKNGVYDELSEMLYTVIIDVIRGSGDKEGRREDNRILKPFLKMAVDVWGQEKTFVKIMNVIEQNNQNVLNAYFKELYKEILKEYIGGN